MLTPDSTFHQTHPANLAYIPGRAIALLECPHSPVELERMAMPRCMDMQDEACRGMQRVDMLYSRWTCLPRSRNSALAELAYVNPFRTAMRRSKRRTRLNNPIALTSGRRRLARPARLVFVAECMLASGTPLASLVARSDAEWLGRCPIPHDLSSKPCRSPHPDGTCPLKERDAERERGNGTCLGRGVWARSMRQRRSPESST